MLVASKVSKSYYIKEKKNFFCKKRKEKEVLKDISIQIEKGKIVGILGENGAGKTTLIKILSTLLTSSNGSVKIDNECISADIKKTRGRINMITGGERNIYWRLSAYENLKYFASLYGIKSKYSEVRIEKLLKNVNLWEQKNIPVEQLSKGMKQRLQIAKGLINNPEYIFLDEPTLGLDVSISKYLRNYIKKIAKEEDKGILLTTHYIKEAEELCDYIYILDKGKIVVEGTKEDIFKKLDMSDTYIVHISNKK